MLIIGSPLGQALVFTNKDDLAGTIEQLSGMLEWAEAADVNPPYIYHQHDDRVSSEDVDKYMDWLKVAFGQAA